MSAAFRTASALGEAYDSAAYDRAAAEQRYMLGEANSAEVMLARAAVDDALEAYRRWVRS